MSGLYNYKWQKARAKYLAENPLCVRCQSLGVTVAATVVDHIIAHLGDLILFWKNQIGKRFVSRVMTHTSSG